MTSDDRTAYEAPAYETPVPTAVEPPLYTRIRAAGVYRDRDRAWFAGVCAGLARSLGVDPLLVRAVFVVLLFLGGVAVPLYLIAWLVMPDSNGRIALQEAVSNANAGYLLILAGAIATSVGSLALLINRPRALIGLTLVALILWVLTRESRRRVPANTAPLPSMPGAPPPPAMTPNPQVPAAAPAPAPAHGPESTPTTVAAPPPVAAPYQEVEDTMSAPYPPGYDPRYSTYDPVQRYGYAYAAPQPAAPTAPQGEAPASPPPPAAPVGVQPAPMAQAWPPGPPPGPVRRRPSGYVGLLSAGVAILALAVGILIHPSTGLPGDPVTFGLLIGLILVSLIVLALSITGRGAGVSALVVFVLATAATGTAAANTLQLSDGVGEVYWVASADSGTPQTFALGVGDASLDVLAPSSGTSAPKNPLPVDAEVNVGQLTITVPDGYAVTVDAGVSLGEIQVQSPDGTVATFSGANDTESSLARTIGSGDTLAVIDAHVNIGTILIIEE